MLGVLRRASLAAASSPATGLRQFQCAYHRSNERLSPVREDQEVSYGLNWAIAGKGVIVKDKVFHNLETSELQKGGATYPDCLSGIPLHVRGDVIGGVPVVSKAQFSKLLKLVTFHLSSISCLYVQDGAVGSSAECDAKVRIISDNPSAVMLLSNVLWKTPDRAISHDTSPLTIYSTSTISNNVKTVLGSGTQYANGFAAADIERSSLILCGKAFADSAIVKDALTAMTAPILSARGGLPVPGWLMCFGGSIVLLFSPVEIIMSWSEIHNALFSMDCGVVISSKGATVLFPTKARREPKLFAKPTAVIIVSSDSTGAIPSISKLSTGQTAYHFLAGYHDGKFVPSYSRAPSPADPLALASSLFSHLKEDDTSAYLINAKNSGKFIDGNSFTKLLKLALSHNLPDIKTEDFRVGELKGKYRNFLSSKFGRLLPDEFSF
uniref:phosphoenolpyruvate carboxykinase (ATP) n=1 Tax=Jansenella griffithiana TaxID=753696 RepID=A0A5P8N5B1_9POAL|nr:phosphoenolpyruvate carboxykinase-like protein [Jansenella griffithiana]